MDAKIHCFSRVQPTGKKRTRCYNVAMKTGWVFLLDALLDGVMVTLALRLGGAKAPVWRIVLAALLGAAAARLCAGLPREGRALLWLPIAMGMMAAACGRAIRPFRAAGLLLGAAGLLGGTIQALSGATGSKATGLLLGTLAIPLLSAAMIRASRMRRDVQTVRVRMTYKRADGAVFSRGGQRQLPSGLSHAQAGDRHPAGARKPAVRAGRYAAAPYFCGYGGRTADDVLPDA